MSETGGVQQIDAIDAEQRLQTGALLLDVREPNEWQAGHAPDALHVPMGEIPQRNDLPSDREIVVVCRSGARSQRVAQFLLANGLRAVNLQGGMQAWAASGFAVVIENGEPGTII